MDFTDISDTDLISKLDTSAAIGHLENSEGWQIVKEACRRKVKQIELALKKVDPSNLTAIIELQARAEIYGEDFIPALINSIKQTGELVFEEMKDRDMIPNREYP